MPSIKTIGSISDTHEQGLNGDFTNIVKVTARQNTKNGAEVFLLEVTEHQTAGILKTYHYLRLNWGTICQKIPILLSDTESMVILIKSVLYLERSII